MMLAGEKKMFVLLAEDSCRKSRKANLALGEEDVSSVCCEINSGDLFENGHGMGGLQTALFANSMAPGLTMPEPL
jgi:predicted alpha/beta-hydrolase family hydrolase